jgi:hypothetical protein
MPLANMKTARTLKQNVRAAGWGHCLVVPL